MMRIIRQRLLQTILVLFGVTLVTFLMMHLAPGHPLQANPELRLDPTAVERWLELQRLDRPLPAQYLSWLSRMARGDFGKSLIYNRPVTDLILERLPATLLLTVTAFCLSMFLSVLCGLYAAINQGSLFDRLTNMLSLAGLALPGFWLGIILMMVFSYHLTWFPSVGMRTPGANSLTDVVLHLFLPVMVLVYGSFAHYVRYVRNAVLGVIGEDFIRAAKARGLTKRYTLFRYILPNAAIPIVTIAALSIPMLFTGAMVAESVFAWPGIGRFILAATLARDYPVIMTVTLYTGTLVALSNLLADILYTLIDPRLRP